MKKPIFLLACLATCLCLFAPAIQAGPVTFIASGVLENGGVLSGDIVIDTTVGSVVSADLIVSGPLSFTATVLDPTNGSFGAFGYRIGVEDSSGDEVFVDPTASTLVGYTGGGICLSGSNCLLSGVKPGNIVFISANLAPAPVPEPASVGLVSSVLLGLILFKRR